jgi:electron transport complex protein RnfG
MLKLGLTLAAFATAACVGLAFVYTSTKDQIEENQGAKLTAALKEIFGDGAAFEELSERLQPGESAVSFGASYAVKEGGVLTGVALNASSQGFNDALTALVGIGVDGNIAGVRILIDTDTPGLGAKAALPEFYGQFTGMTADGGVKVQKDGGGVEAVSAATITSRAVSLIVNVAGEFGKKWLAAQGALQ